MRVRNISGAGWAALLHRVTTDAMADMLTQDLPTDHPMHGRMSEYKKVIADEVRERRTEEERKRDPLLAQEARDILPGQEARAKAAEALRNLWAELAASIPPDLLFAFHRTRSEVERIQGLVSEREGALRAHNNTLLTKSEQIGAWSLTKAQLEADAGAHARLLTTAQAEHREAAAAIVGDLCARQGTVVGTAKLAMLEASIELSVVTEKLEARAQEATARVDDLVRVFSELGQHGPAALHLPDMPTPEATTKKRH